MLRNFRESSNQKGTVKEIAEVPADNKTELFETKFMASYRRAEA